VCGGEACVDLGAERPALWVAEPVEVEVRDGICYCHIRSGKLDIELRSSISTMAISLERMAAAYADHLGRTPAQIVKLSERGPMFLKEDRAD
jgi:hypothetical protein